MIRRPKHLARLAALLKGHPVVAILGARQVGKTTLAGELRKHWKQPGHLFDLEHPADLARLSDPLLALSPLRASSSWMKSSGNLTCSPCFACWSTAGRYAAAFSLWAAPLPTCCARGMKRLLDVLPIMHWGAFQLRKPV